MSVFVPGTRIGKAIQSLKRSDVPSLANLSFVPTDSSAITKGREEFALSSAKGENVYAVNWKMDDGSYIILCFFGDSEWEVLDRLNVAEIMLG